MADDPTRAPRVDARGAEELAAETAAMLASLTAGAWTPAPAGQAHDPLGALVHVFAGMAARVLDGINAVPDASLAAFLRLIGVEAQRPAAARAPLTFALVENAPGDAVVPAGTHVGATPAEGDTSSEELVFETEAELFVTRARLVAVHAHDPATDRLDGGDGPLRVFAPQTPAVHELAIACPSVLAREGAASWTITVEFASRPEGREFSVCHADGAGPIAATVGWQDARLVVSLTRPPVLRPAEIAGRTDAWLALRLVPREGPPPALPAVRRVHLAARFADEGIAPRKVLCGSSVLESITDLRPFGGEPVLGDTFSVEGGAALTQPVGTSVALAVTLAAAVASEATRPKATADLRLVWELLDPSGMWVEVGRSSGTDPAVLGTDGGNPHGFVDDTYALTRPGRVRFRLPFTPAPGRCGGQTGRWLRARIVQGGYSELVPGAPASATATETPPTVTQRPPQIGTLRLSYEHILEGVPAAVCVARDLGHVRDLGPLDGQGAAQQAFTARPPGAPELGDRPALYLGFDRASEPRRVDVYFEVFAPDPADTAPPDELPPPSDAPRVEWEYHGARGWTRLGVRDGTDALRQRGLVGFIAPQDLREVALFGRRGFWLRARWVSGRFRAPPRVGRIRPNTIWAAHSATRRGEILGSGTGSPGQRFRLVAAPVLGGERIEVRELDRPGEREVAALRAELGDEAVTLERDASGEPTAAWVRWTPVTHFHGSGPADRHYVLDAETGELRFGDGLSGRTLPRGRSNVRAAVYRTGGGTRGNRPEGVITELKTAIAHVASVTNVDAASGGAGREDDARVRARGPRRLRHGGRAVTASDLEDLAFEAAPEVARAHALTAVFNPIDVGIDLTAPGAGTRDERGWIAGASVPQDTASVSQRVAEVRLVIVPRSDADQPAPSVGLLEHVEAFLGARAPPALRVYACGPRWLRVIVRAEVVPTAEAAADRLLADMRAAITRFLHPLTGGEQGLGWDFGRIPRRSHLYRLLAPFPGVQHIAALAVITEPPLPEINEPLTESQRRVLAGALVYSGKHELVLVGPAEES